MKNSASKTSLKHKNMKAKAAAITAAEKNMPSNSIIDDACSWMHGFIIGTVLGLSLASLITMLIAHC